MLRAKENNTLMPWKCAYCAHDIGDGVDRDYYLIIGGLRSDAWRGRCPMCDKRLVYHRHCPWQVPEFLEKRWRGE